MVSRTGLCLQVFIFTRKYWKKKTIYTLPQKWNYVLRITRTVHTFIENLKKNSDKITGEVKKNKIKNNLNEANSTFLFGKDSSVGISFG